MGAWIIDTRTEEGRKFVRDYENIPTVSSSEFGPGHYEVNGKLYKGKYPNGKLVDKDGTNSINLKGPDAMSGITTYTFPAAPEANKILLTDGDGNLSWTESFDSDLNVTGIVTATGGFNIGINVGKVSGQTVMHTHIHLIPRYKGDVSDPRGGVRGVIPSKQKY